MVATIRNDTWTLNNFGSTKFMLPPGKPEVELKIPRARLNHISTALAFEQMKFQML